MKQFYRDVAAVATDGGHVVHLDGRLVRTPARAPLLLPTLALAEAVVAEWQVQSETIDPRSMAYTGLSNAAIDQIAPDPATFAADIARYGESDLLCYRAEGPAPLVERQAQLWDPLLAWARERYDIGFRVTKGVLPVDQPPETIARLGRAVEAFDSFLLAGLSTLVSLGGSLVCGLALVEGAAGAELIWAATELEEYWQVEQWGDNSQAAVQRALRHLEFDVAAAFCRMVTP